MELAYFFHQVKSRCSLLQPQSVSLKLSPSREAASCVATQELPQSL
jgi:hypothetical protein